MLLFDAIETTQTEKCVKNHIYFGKLFPAILFGSEFLELVNVFRLE